MKITKLSFILFFAVFILVTSCGDKCKNGDCLVNNCNSITIDINFLDKDLGIDITGDSIELPIVRYDKDSIKYRIESINDTTILINPIITKVGFNNTFSINNYRYNGIGLYKVLLYLNSVEKDTIIVDILSNKNFNYYYRDSLLSNPSVCGYLNYKIKK